MKYYLLRSDSNPANIGVDNCFQGHIIWEKFCNIEDRKKITEYFSIEKLIKNSSHIVPIDFTIEYVEAEAQAIMTDFFIFSPALYGISFFISNKVVEILNLVNLPLHVYIPVNIYKSGQKFEYYALYLPVHYREDAVDFSESLFYKGIPYSFTPKEYLFFNSKEEYKSFKGLRSAEKIKYNDKFNPTLDLFKSLFSQGQYYISEKLKIEFERHSVTGITIHEAKEPVLLF